MSRLKTWLAAIGGTLLAGLIAALAVWSAKRSQEATKKARRERSLERAVSAHADEAGKHRAKAQAHERRAQEAAERARQRIAKVEQEVSVAEFVQEWSRDKN